MNERSSVKRTFVHRASMVTVPCTDALRRIPCGSADTPSVTMCPALLSGTPSVMSGAAACGRSDNAFLLMLVNVQRGGVGHTLLDICVPNDTPLQINGLGDNR